MTEPVIPVVLFLERQEYAFALRRDLLLKLQDEAGRIGDRGPLFPDGYPIGMMAMVGAETEDEVKSVLSWFLICLRQLNDISVQEAISECSGLIVFRHADRREKSYYAAIALGEEDPMDEALETARRNLPEMHRMMEKEARNTPADTVQNVAWKPSKH